TDTSSSWNERTRSRLKFPNAQLWSVALQLVEAVAFMHEHNVTHMDLKPQNAIIPTEGGRLSIIDFSVSIRVRSPDTSLERGCGHGRLHCSRSTQWTLQTDAHGPVELWPNVGRIMCRLSCLWRSRKTPGGSQTTYESGS
ncbi:hypothetical protein L210DRAFT_3539271, partial [Boletus edulis BED1]